MSVEAGKADRRTEQSEGDANGGATPDANAAADPAAAKKPAKVKDFRIFNEEVAAIVAGVHANPFAVLGLHEFGKEFVVRAFVPGAEENVAMSDRGVHGCHRR